MPGSREAETRRRLSSPVTGGYSRATALLRGTSHSPATQAPTAEAKEKLVNDRPSSGQYPENGYDGLSTTTFAGDQAHVSYETQGQGYNYGASAAYDAYGAYQSTGTYDATAWTGQESYLSTVPGQAVPEDTTGQWDAAAWNDANTAEYQPTSFGHESTVSEQSPEQTAQWNTFTAYGQQDTGTYDATAWNTGHGDGGYGDNGYGDSGYDEVGYDDTSNSAAHNGYETYAYEATSVVPVIMTEDVPSDAADIHAPDIHALDIHAAETAVFEALSDDDAPEPSAAVHAMATQTMPVTPGATTESRASRRAGSAKSGNAKTGSTKTNGAKTGGVRSANAKAAGGSSRRRTPAKRSALLTVAVPSACVMGVAGVAAASVGGLTGTDKPAQDTTTMAAADPASVKPVAANNKLDTQLTALSADAGDFADRASRTQERLDLRQRQEEEKKKRAEEAAAKEAARPKFAIPVTQHGLSAGFGQAGGMWMSVHTGIDFPVSYGTPVMAATDGTVRTQWNSAYGNMAIVTSPDGTETWYCHLSSTKIRSGKVKAGDVIAYSGNSGNSTGPHLHFEVRPGAGSPIDPQAWLRSHGLDPT
ncbi:M23 family metallopeptidase [Streptomyces sp. NPDC053429]|uniref:M23 family metallopeptidase n=1 Tax=Streptomyces sp. NPDC053429 TaxID=3365702 RepID=UPI0037D2F94C